MTLRTILFLWLLLPGSLPDSFAYAPAKLTARSLPQAYTWDGYNRLTKVESKAGAPNASNRKVLFTYDSAGRRISRITSAADATGTYRETDNKKFVYDGWKLTAELNGTNSAIIRSYLWAGNLLLSISQNGKTYLPTFDGRGNVMSLVQEDNKAVVARYDYNAFGTLLRASGPMALENPIRFSSEYQDDVTGFVYYGYRYYNPNTFTWLSRDPIGMAGGFNLYALANNDPVNARDYLGLATYLSESATFFGIRLPDSAIGYRLPVIPASIIDQAESLLALPAEAILNTALMLESIGTAVTTPITGMNLQDTLLSMPMGGPEAAMLGELESVVALSRARLLAKVCSTTERTLVADVVASERIMASDLALLKIECPPMLSPAAKTGANLTKLAEQDVVVGMMKEGQVLKQVPYPSNPMLAPTHEAIAKELGVWAGKGELAPGVEAFTVWKEGGKVMVRGSGNFTPTVSAETEAALRKLFE